MAIPVLAFSESNGATPTVTDNITNLQFASIDNNSLVSNLFNNNPVAQGANSFEKWIRMKVVTASTNGVSNFGVYFSSTPISDANSATNTITCKFGTNGAYATPTAAASTVATVLCSTVTGSPGTAFTAPSNTVGSYSGYITLQAIVGSGAAGTNATFPSNYLNTIYTYF
jgi:hypothetical protein